jgi:hypothetical protein
MGTEGTGAVVISVASRLRHNTLLSGAIMLPGAVTGLAA